MGVSLTSASVVFPCTPPAQCQGHRGTRRDGHSRGIGHARGLRSYDEVVEAAEGRQSCGCEVAAVLVGPSPHRLLHLRRQPQARSAVRSLRPAAPEELAMPFPHLAPSHADAAGGDIESV